MRLTSVEATGNFAENLLGIETYLHENLADTAFDTLVTQLYESVIPNLKRFPQAGRPFRQRPQHAAETALMLPTLQARLLELGFGSELREYLMQNYLILYTFNDHTGYLLSIKHHRQLAFDFSAMWDIEDYPPNQSVHGKLLLQQDREKYDVK